MVPMQPERRAVLLFKTKKSFCPVSLEIPLVTWPIHSFSPFLLSPAQGQLVSRHLPGMGILGLFKVLQQAGPILSFRIVLRSLWRWEVGVVPGPLAHRGSDELPGGPAEVLGTGNVVGGHREGDSISSVRLSS